MGSGGGNTGGGADSKPTRSGDFIRGKAAGMRTDSSRALPGAKKREEERLRRSAFMTGDASYVRGGGDIVRDSSGAGVLTGVGIQRAEASRQIELETLISQRQGGSGDPEAEKRAMAIQQLEKRKEQTLPGFLGAISRMNIERQLADLKAGGTPQFGMTAGGTFVTRGVTPEGTAAPLADAPNIQPMFGQTRQNGQRADVTPAVTPEVTPEIVPDDTMLMGGRERGRRRTRGTRLGQAGEIEEGYGVLLRQN